MIAHLLSYHLRRCCTGSAILPQSLKVPQGVTSNHTEFLVYDLRLCNRDQHVLQRRLYAGGFLISSGLATVYALDEAATVCECDCYDVNHSLLLTLYLIVAQGSSTSTAALFNSSRLVALNVVRNHRLRSLVLKARLRRNPLSRINLAHRRALNQLNRVVSVTPQHLNAGYQIRCKAHLESAVEDGSTNYSEVLSHVQSSCLRFVAYIITITPLHYTSTFFALFFASVFCALLVFLC